MLKTLCKAGAFAVLTGVAFGEPDSPTTARGARRDKLSRMRRELAEQMASVEAEMVLVGDEPPVPSQKTQLPKVLAEADGSPVELKTSAEALITADGAPELARLREQVAALEAAAAERGDGGAEPKPRLGAAAAGPAAEPMTIELAPLTTKPAETPLAAEADAKPGAPPSTGTEESGMAPAEAEQAARTESLPGAPAATQERAGSAESTEQEKQIAAAPAATQSSGPNAIAESVAVPNVIAEIVPAEVVPAEVVPAEVVPAQVVPAQVAPATDPKPLGSGPEQRLETPIGPVASVSIVEKDAGPAPAPEAPDAAVLGGANLPAVGYDQADPATVQTEKIKELRSLRNGGGRGDKGRDRRSKRRAADRRAQADRDSRRVDMPASLERPAEPEQAAAGDGAHHESAPPAANPGRATGGDDSGGYGTMFGFAALIVGLFAAAGYVVKQSIIPGTKRRDSFAACSTKPSSTDLMSSFGTTGVYNRKCGRASFGV